MYIISPMSNCGSPQKRDRFLQLLTAVAETTAANEPDVAAYAWFRSAEDNDEVPHHWVRGFEVYTHLEASSKTHRESEAYRNFRSACGSEALLDRPSDLRYLEPLDIGFLSRKNEPITLQGRQPGNSAAGYVVMEVLRPKSECRDQLISCLRELASVVEALKGTVTSFWVLGYRVEDNDSAVLVFQRFGSKELYESQYLTLPKVKDAMEPINGLVEWQQRTTWRDGSIGFIGRT
ncbi:hypothetical protein GQ53DRAFT_837637 [Thozetella sp. PMI_491]|nr:hypothetical protein GQ53DRAFT_837637 [Thozetella sp. PMI_491]